MALCGCKMNEKFESIYMWKKKKISIWLIHLSTTTTTTTENMKRSNIFFLDADEKVFINIIIIIMIMMMMVGINIDYSLSHNQPTIFGFSFHFSFNHPPVTLNEWINVKWKKWAIFFLCWLQLIIESNDDEIWYNRVYFSHTHTLQASIFQFFFLFFLVQNFHFLAIAGQKKSKM